MDRCKHSVQSIRDKLNSQKTIGVMQYFMPNLRYQKLGSNTITNSQFIENTLRLTIWSLNTTRKNFTGGLTSGILTAKRTIKLSGVILRTINHQQNAASGRSVVSTYRSTLWYIDHHCFVENNNSTVKLYSADYAHTILSVWCRKLLGITTRMDGSFWTIHTTR